MVSYGFCTTRVLRQRHDMLKGVLRKQVKIAEHLSTTEGKYSRESVWAWDVVEEISRKLSILESNIRDLEYSSYHHRNKLEYDYEQSIREYDV